ncbi:hypothetical protein COOONC_27137 [Cooperia oncophora]
MSCRSTRARAAKIVLEEPLEQTRKITDVFKVTRGRGRTQKKLHGDETRVDTKPLLASGFIQQELTEGVCSSAKAETICSPPKRAKKCTDHTQRSARKILFATDDNKKSSPKKEMVVEVSQTDVLLPKLKHVLAYEVLRNFKQCWPKKALSKQFMNRHSGSRAKSRGEGTREGCLQCSEVCAYKGSARGELTNWKAKLRAHQKRLEPSTSVVPDFILPTHKTPAKASLDEFELNETRHVFEYGKSFTTH